MSNVSVRASDRRFRVQPARARETAAIHTSARRLAFKPRTPAQVSAQCQRRSVKRKRREATWVAGGFCKIDNRNGNCGATPSLSICKGFTNCYTVSKGEQTSIRRATLAHRNRVRLTHQLRSSHSKQTSVRRDRSSTSIRSMHCLL